ncbi:hypothetical protein [Streptobacillus canis]|uniref:hypothetical protein n=1 Tax=Streptobacillus canis TaxID=2678686 RepID=UPI0012E26B86|nr:hypothetical protein [Streptobacillus canis]
MKKIVFGLLAITSMVSMSATTGNFEIEGNVEFGKGTNLDLNGKTKLGMYLDSQKDAYFFINLEGAKKDVLDTNTSEAKHLVGLSYEKNLGDKTDVGVYAAYKNLVNRSYDEDKSFKNELTNHLSVKNKYKDDFNFFQKTDALNRLGYKEEKGKNTIIGAHANTRINRTDLYAGGSFTTKDYAKGTNRFYSYLETNTMYDLGFFNTKFIYDVNTETQQKTKVISNKAKEGDINVAENGGALNVDLKFSSSRIIPDTFFYNQAKLDLKSGFKATEEGERFLEFEQKNYFKYTGIKNLTVVAKADYELKHSVYVDGKAKKTKKGESNLIDENKHTVRVTGNANYVTDKYRLFGEFSTSNSVSLGKTIFTNHSYDLKAIYEHNVLDNLKLITDGAFKTYISFAPISDATLGFGYKSSGRDGRLIYDSSSSLKYRMLGQSNKGVTHSIFALSENKLTYLNRGVKVEGNLNFANEYEMVTEIKKVKKDEVITNTNNLLLFLNPGFKASYKKDKGYIGTETQFAYSRDMFNSENAENRYGLMNKNEVKYNVEENITLTAGLDVDYRVNKLSFDHMNNFKDYTENLGHNLFRFYKYRKVDENETKYEYNEAKELSVKDMPEKDREIKVKVGVGSELKFVENRLTVKPTTSFTYVYKKDKDIDAVKKYIGNVGLNISYNW